MKTLSQIRTLSQILQLLALSSVMATALAQDVSVPDPGLNAAIRDELQKPAGPLTAQDMLSLTNLDAGGRDVRSIEGLEAAHNLAALNLNGNLLTSLTLPAGLTNLTTLDLGGNQLTNFSFLSGLARLTTLGLGGNQLTSLTLPAGLTSLTFLDLSYNQLTSLTLPAGLTNLTSLELSYSQLTNFSFLSGLTSLATLKLTYSQLTSFTLPAGLTSLYRLELYGNLLTTFVLPEPLAVTALAGTVADLRSQGVAVYTHPLAVGLVSPQRTLAGIFGFTLTGPPAAYTIFSSTDLATWDELGTVTNVVGAVVFIEAVVTNSSQKFYRARQVQ